MKHSLIKTGDPDAFEQIQDRNGEVVLSYCRVCHEGEGTLAGSCPGLRACCARTRDKVLANTLTFNEVRVLRMAINVFGALNSKADCELLMGLLKRTGNQ